MKLSSVFSYADIVDMRNEGLNDDEIINKAKEKIAYQKSPEYGAKLKAGEIENAKRKELEKNFANYAITGQDQANLMSGRNTADEIASKYRKNIQNYEEKQIYKKQAEANANSKQKKIANAIDAMGGGLGETAVGVAKGATFIPHTIAKALANNTDSQLAKSFYKKSKQARSNLDKAQELYNARTGQEGKALYKTGEIATEILTDPLTYWMPFMKAPTFAARGAGYALTGGAEGALHEYGSNEKASAEDIAKMAGLGAALGLGGGALIEGAIKGGGALYSKFKNRGAGANTEPNSAPNTQNFSTAPNTQNSNADDLATNGSWIGGNTPPPNGGLVRGDNFVTDPKSANVEQNIVANFELSPNVRDLTKISTDEISADLSHLSEKHPEMFEKASDVFKLIKEIKDEPQFFYRNNRLDGALIAKRLQEQGKIGKVVVNKENGEVIHATKAREQDLARLERVANKNDERVRALSAVSSRKVEQGGGLPSETIPQHHLKTADIIDLVPDENGVYGVAYNGSSKELAKIATEIAKGEPVSNGAKRLVYIADNIAEAAAKDAEQKISANIAKIDDNSVELYANNTALLADIAKKYPMLNKDEQIELVNKQILANASAELLEYSKFLNGGKLPNDARLLGKNAGRMILKSLNAGASKQEIIDMLLKAGISGRNSTAAKALIQTRDINAYNAVMRQGEAELIAELSNKVRVAAKNESIGTILGSAKEKAIKNDELLKKRRGKSRASKCCEKSELVAPKNADEVAGNSRIASDEVAKVAENTQGNFEIASYKEKKEILAATPMEQWSKEQKEFFDDMPSFQKDEILEASKIKHDEEVFGKIPYNELSDRNKRKVIDEARFSAKGKELQAQYDKLEGAKYTAGAGGKYPSSQQLAKITKTQNKITAQRDELINAYIKEYDEKVARNSRIASDKTAWAYDEPNAYNAKFSDIVDTGKSDELFEALAKVSDPKKQSAMFKDFTLKNRTDEFSPSGEYNAKFTDESKYLSYLKDEIKKLKSTLKASGKDNMKFANEYGEFAIDKDFFGKTISPSSIKNDANVFDKIDHYTAVNNAFNIFRNSKKLAFRKGFESADPYDVQYYVADAIINGKQTQVLFTLRELKDSGNARVYNLELDLSPSGLKANSGDQPPLANKGHKSVATSSEAAPLKVSKNSTTSSLKSQEQKRASLKRGFSTAEMPSAMLGGAAGHMVGSATLSGAGEYESEGGVAGAIIGALAGLASPKAAAKIAAKMIAKKASKIELMPNMPFKEAQDKVQKDLMKYVGVDIKNADSGIVAQINNNGAKKIVSNDAIQKSRNNKFSAGEHLSVAQKTPELFKNATFIGRYDDIKNGESSVKILRFAKNIEVKGKNAVAIITAKESVDKDLKRIYSMELEELRKAELKFGNYDKNQTPASKPLISQDNGVVNSVAPIKDGANSTPKEIKSQEQKRTGLKRGFSTQALNELMLGLGSGGVNAMAEDDPNKKAEAFIKGFLAGFGGAKAASMLVKNAQKLAPQLARASEKMASDFPRLLNDRPDILGGVLGRMNNPKDKFSFIFGGEKALGANKAKLEKAKYMAKNGADESEIWAKTGWYKDIDGKWKFEINAEGGKLKELNAPELDEATKIIKRDYFDKQMNLKELEDFIQFKNGYIDFDAIKKFYDLPKDMSKGELTQKFPYFKMSVNDYMEHGFYKDIDLLHDEIMPARKILNQEYSKTPLNEVLDDPELFASYPQLKDVKVSVDELAIGQKAHFNPSKNEIVLSSALDAEDMQSSLYHEIQHKVQEIEDFARGGNLGNLNYKKLAGEAEARNVQARQAMLKTADKEAEKIAQMIKDPQKAMAVSRDLANVDDFVRLSHGNYKVGAKHINLRHTSDPNKIGYVSDDEISRLGENMRKFLLKHKEPYLKDNKFVYEWAENGNAYTLVTDSRSLSKPDIFNPTSKTLRAPATDNRSLQLAPFNRVGTPAKDEIITFYSNRNLKTNGAYKFTNPEMTWQKATLPNSQLPHPDKTMDIEPNERIVSFDNSAELSMRESFSPELKASYDMRDKLLKSTNEVRASLNEKGKAELEKLAGSKDSKLSRDAQIMKTLENAKSNAARYAKLKKLYLDENGKVKDSIGLC